MKDLHIKLDYGETKIINELQQKYNCNKTDLISSLLEIAYGCTCCDECYEYWSNKDQDMKNYMDEFRFELFNAINNRK